MDGAAVCVDLNGNRACDDNEPSGKTDATGYANISIPADLLSKLSANGGIRLIASAGKGAKSHLPWSTSELTQDLILTSRTYSPKTYKSDAADIICEDRLCDEFISRITPFSTLADTAAGDEEMTQKAYQALMALIAKSLGIEGNVLGSDYLEGADTPAALGKNKLKALLADELIIGMGMTPSSAKVLKKGSAGLNADGVMKELTLINERLDVAVAEIMDKSKDDSFSFSDYQANLSNVMEKSFVQLSSGRGEDFRCGVNENHRVLCWGNNSWGNLGDPKYFTDPDGNLYEDGASVKDLYSWKMVTVRKEDGTPLNNVLSVETGSKFACAVTFSGEVYCWGSNKYGQLGNGEFSAVEPAAVQVLNARNGNGDSEYLNNAEYLAISNNSVCASVLKEPPVAGSGNEYQQISKLLCWGDNTSKQLGRDLDDDETSAFATITDQFGDPLPQSVTLKAVPYPVEVAFPDTVASVGSVTAGAWAYCATTTSEGDDKNTIYCWGNDSHGLVTHNWRQYMTPEIAKDYAKYWVQDGHTLGDGYHNAGLALKDRHILDSDGDYHPLFSAPVTAVKDAKYLEFVGSETFFKSPATANCAFWDSDPTKTDSGVNCYNYPVLVGEGKSAYQNYLPVPFVDHAEFVDKYDKYNTFLKECRDNAKYSDCVGVISEGNPDEHGTVGSQFSVNLYGVVSHDLVYAGSRISIDAYDSALFVSRNVSIEGSLSEQWYWVGNQNNQIGSGSVNTPVWTSEGTDLAFISLPLISEGSFHKTQSAKTGIRTDGLVISDPSAASRYYLANSTGWLFEMTSGESRYGSAYPGVSGSWLDQSGDPYYMTNYESLPAYLFSPSMGKHSKCIVAPAEKAGGATRLYCWGSDIFGQMGQAPKDDVQKGVSYNDVADAWIYIYDSHSNSKVDYDVSETFNIDPYYKRWEWGANTGGPASGPYNNNYIGRRGANFGPGTVPILVNTELAD